MRAKRVSFTTEISAPTIFVEKENLWEREFTRLWSRRLKAAARLTRKKRNFLIERQIKGGVKGVVLVGTTGEAPTLSREEKDMIVERAVKKFKGRTTIIAGCGSFDTRQAVSLAKRYGDMGADFLFVRRALLQQARRRGNVFPFCCRCRRGCGARTALQRAVPHGKLYFAACARTAENALETSRA